MPIYQKILAQRGLKSKNKFTILIAIVATIPINKKNQDDAVSRHSLYSKQFLQFFCFESGILSAFTPKAPLKNYLLSKAYFTAAKNTAATNKLILFISLPLCQAIALIKTSSILSAPVFGIFPNF